ncbi:MAG: hypothetical protein HW403_209 [Dehalococcoidia bacterium]|nr:hypothetical protein [Dehalococcoidia bacterium]
MTPAPLLGPKAAILCLILIAFLLRIYNLGFESLDMDEADGVYLASLPVSDLLGLLVQVGHSGYLYMLLLKGWIALAGATEFSIRYMALMPGVLVVPIIYRLGLRLLEPRAALLAAALATFSSYILHFSQMNRMYTLLLFLGILSSYLLLRALDHHRWRWWIAYGFSVMFAVYVHVFAVLLVPWHLCYLLLQFKEHPSNVAKGLVVLSGIGLPHLPIGLWLLRALEDPRVLNREFTGSEDALGMLATLAREYGTRFDLLPQGLIASFFLGLSVVGIVGLAGSPRGRRAALFLALGVAMPLLLVYLLTLARIPAFSSRYLIVTLPGFLLLWAGALYFVHSRVSVLGWVLLAAILGLNAARWAQTNVYGKHFREDWRSAAGYLSEQYRQGDLVILGFSNAKNAYDYYATEPVAMIGIDQLEGNGGKQALSQELDRVTKGYENLWLLYSYFQIGGVESITPWLNEKAKLLDQVHFAGVTVSRFALMGGDG